MKKNKQETDFATKNNWWSFCDNFLSIAKVGCLEMLYQKYPKHKEIPRKALPFWKYNLYIATVFNLKHSLEIFLKYLIFILKDEFPKFKNEDGHNIKYFLEIFQNECDLEKIHNLITKAIKEKKESKYAIEVAEQIAKYKEEMINDIASISLKYFNLQDVKRFIGNKKIEDIKNQYYRYPDNKNLSEKINYNEILHNINDEEVMLVLSDIYKLEKAINPLVFVIQTYKDIK